MSISKGIEVAVLETPLPDPLPYDYSHPCTASLMSQLLCCLCGNGELVHSEAEGRGTADVAHALWLCTGSRTLGVAYDVRLWVQNTHDRRGICSDSDDGAGWARVNVAKDGFRTMVSNVLLLTPRSKKYTKIRVISDCNQSSSSGNLTFSCFEEISLIVV
jgi:hypothetical protein